MNDSTNNISDKHSEPSVTDNKGCLSSKEPCANQSMMTAGCCKKMMTACKDMCDRFCKARISITYHMTTCISGIDRAQGEDAKKQPNQPNNRAQENKPSGANTMVKDGTLELRLTDVVVGATLLGTFMTLWVTVKKMFCCR